MNQYQVIAEKIKTADAILIGASNGLSITEGLHLFADNSAWEEIFGDFKKKYSIRCILQSMGTQWACQEEKWAFWSRLIHHYCGQYQPSQAMQDLKAIVGGKDYFIVTSNGECHFEMSGFAPEKIFEMEGNWLTMQCQNACHDTLYPTLELAEKMAAAEQNGMIPSEFIPYCPKCGSPMAIHMVGSHFLPMKKEQLQFEKFLNKYHGRNIVILELGVGWRNQLIKAPFMRLTAQEPNATYVIINLGEIYIPENIQNKSFGLDGYLDEMLKKLRISCEN